MKILANKEYAYWLAEQTFQKEFYKFPQHNITYDGMKELLSTNYIQDVPEYKNKKCIVLGNGGSVLDNERGLDIDKFDLIVSNPPFHTGIATDYTIAEAFLSNAKQHLTKVGKLSIVANSFLKYPPILEAQFGSFHTVYKNNKFAVYSS